MTHTALGRLIEDESFLRGISEAELARRMGMKRQQLSRYKYAKRHPYRAQMERLASGLDLGYNELMGLLQSYEERTRSANG